MVVSGNNGLFDNLLIRCRKVGSEAQVRAVCTSIVDHIKGSTGVTTVQSEVVQLLCKMLMRILVVSSGSMAAVDEKGRRMTSRTTEVMQALQLRLAIALNGYLTLKVAPTEPRKQG
jgi:hypothetical protein